MMKDVSVSLPFDSVFCSRHGEPFRAAWPKGYIAFAVAALTEVLKDKRFLKSARVMARGPMPGVEEINALLAEKPACCWLADHMLLQLYTESGVGIEAKCHNCAEVRLGTPYKTVMANAGHICFHCVIHCMEKF